ncbi:MAG TPA: YrzE family protein [Ktedonobacteraceae bacterium]|nr:YrzE family protein [Ktedonobacteraceae bacterium]
MQDATTQRELHPTDSGGGLPSINNESTGQPGNEPKAADEPGGILKDETPAAGTPSPLQGSSPRSNQHALLPRRGLYYAAIAGIIAGVFAALLTIVITLVNAGTFHAASQQIAVDKLTVKTALALAAWELLNFTLSLIIGFFVGFIVGRIAVRRRLGFLAGALAGAVFYLITFLVSLISSYPGNLAVNGTTLTTGSLIISLLLLCLWSIGGGLVSLFGTWVATVRHPHYMKLEE